MGDVVNLPPKPHPILSGIIDIGALFDASDADRRRFSAARDKMAVAMLQLSEPRLSPRRTEA